MAADFVAVAAVLAADVVLELAAVLSTFSLASGCGTLVVALLVAVLASSSTSE